MEDYPMSTVFFEKGRKYNCRVHGKPYYRTSVTIDGKRRQVYGDGEKDAQRKVEALKQLSKGGVNLDHTKAKVADAFSYWLFNVKWMDVKVKASSFARYESVYRLYVRPCDISGLRMCELTHAVMQCYANRMYEEKGVSTATIRYTLSIWKMFTRWAVAEGYLARDPCKSLIVPGGTGDRAGKREIETFSEEERRDIIKMYLPAAQIRKYDLLRLVTLSGVRTLIASNKVTSVPYNAVKNVIYAIRGKKDK